MTVSKIEVWACRLYQRAGAAWLMTLNMGLDHAVGETGNKYVSGYPQAHAVVNDFGDLVAVEAWK